MKRMILALLIVLLTLSCTACGSRNPLPGEPFVSDGTAEPNVPENPPEDEDGLSQPEKIPLDGQTVSYNQFPIPEAAAYGLTGEEAQLYEAAVSLFNRESCPEYFASDEHLSLILPGVVLYGQYEAEDGGTAYVVGFERCFIYDLGSGLEDISSPAYTSDCLGGLALLTLDENGILTAFDEYGDGEDESAVYRICGPLTELAEEALQPGGVQEEGKTRIPDAGDVEGLLLPYLNYYFEN